MVRWFTRTNDGRLAAQYRLLTRSTSQGWRSLLLSGRLAAFEVARKERIETLADVEFRVCSQWGEDGIIEWLCTRLPGMPRRFVEFGVETYEEANTRFLAENRGWAGLIIDSNPKAMARQHSGEFYWRHDIVAVAAFVTAENIDVIISKNGFGGEIGILSVDIDGADYWVLKAIESARPWIVICEINAVFGDRHDLTVPYRADFDRMKAHHSALYFGASIGAIRRLCREKGYSFIGTNTTGVNAFFVRDDVAGHVLPNIAEARAWPSRHRESRGPGGELTFLRGLARAEAIRDMPVIDVTTGTTAPLERFFPLYSEAWLAEI